MTDICGGSPVTVDLTPFMGFNPFAPDYHVDPYAQYRQLALNGPLQRTPGGLWVATSYELCADILRDSRFGHDPGDDVGVAWRDREALEDKDLAFIRMDPPDHTRLRRLVSTAFTSRLVQRLRPRVESLVDELLSAAVRDSVHGEFDLIAALADPLPISIIGDLLGIPKADLATFSARSRALGRGTDPDLLLPKEDIEAREAAHREFGGYFRELARRRRSDPRDDLLTALVRAEDDGERLTEAELVATCILLLGAGHETTVNLIGNGTLALLRNPDQLAQLREHPERAPSLVEEVLRYDPPAQFTARVALVDAELRGELIRRGESVLVLIGAANRDPAAFADPDRLDMNRPAKRHLSFGIGIHFCIGSPLATLEGEVALSRLTRMGITLPEDHTLEYRPNIVLRGLAALPVRLDGPVSSARAREAGVVR
jgi:unspecific monooxygenase